MFASCQDEFEDVFFTRTSRAPLLGLFFLPGDLRNVVSGVGQAGKSERSDGRELGDDPDGRMDD